MIPDIHIADTAVMVFTLTLFHSLWQFLLIAIVWSLLLLFTKDAPSFTRYYITLLALAAIPAAFIITLLRTVSHFNAGRQIPEELIIARDMQGIMAGGEETGCNSCGRIKKPITEEN